MHEGVVCVLDPDDASALAELAEGISKRYRSSEDAAFLRALPVLAHDVPRSLRETISAFRQADAFGFLHVKGNHVDSVRIGPTPLDWRSKVLPGPAFPEEVLILLYAALLGDPFGWETQQNGRLIHEVFPVKDDVCAQLGTGSGVPLSWHTEDAFHPCRADYVILLALRNDMRVPTTVAHLDIRMVDSDLLDILFSERFIVKPDDSHLPESNTTSSVNGEAFAAIARMHEEPSPTAVLFGSRQAPYLRLDPYFMEAVPGDRAAAHALHAVADIIDESLIDIVLEAGDVIILDNMRVVHGRPSFQAKFDGTDRWLKRVNVTRDLRKSRAHRAAAESRLIGSSA